MKRNEMKKKFYLCVTGNKLIFLCLCLIRFYSIRMRKKNLEKIMPENMHKKLLHACGIEFMEEEIKGKFLFIDLLPFGY